MVETVVQYLARDELYEMEKPYSAEFELEDKGNAKKTNYILSPQNVAVEPVKLKQRFNLDTHGFIILSSKTELQAEDALSKPDMVEAAYMAEIKALLQEHFPEYRRLEGIEFVVRKRDERFPADELAIVSHEQPACLVHSDYSVDGAMMQLKASFPGQDDILESAEFDIINVWRPLLGPNDDWPLALCDYTSIDSHDIAVADLLHASRIGENQLLHYNKRHRWYYIPQQQPDDLLVFRNVDSTGKRSRGFHCSFFNPESQSPPRCSCEVRFVGFR